MNMAIESLINDTSVHLTSKLMELSFERQRVIANNLANANTPHYTRHDINFQDQLAELIDNNKLENVDTVKGVMVEDKSNPARLDGNNVQAADEMNQMMENSVLHNLLTRVYSTKMKIMEQAISSK